MDDKKKKIMIVMGILLIFTTSGMIYFFLKTMDDHKIVKEPLAQEGNLEGKTLEEIQADMDEKVDQGSLIISINSDLVFLNGTAQGDLRIENSINNHYRMIVEIYMEDGTKVYESGAIDPGYYVEKDRLDVALKKGDYPVTVYFRAYDLEQDTLIGKAATKTMIHILE